MLLENVGAIDSPIPKSGWYEPCPAKLRKATNMDTSALDKYLLWESQQDQNKLRKHREFRQVVKHFVLVFSLAAITVSVAAMLPH